MKTRTILAILLAALIPAAVAQAQPVSTPRAKLAIRFDQWDYPNDTPHVQWCRQQRLGTICLVTSGGVCYDDQAFGSSELVSRDLVWVSRNPHHHKVSVHPAGQLPYEVYTKADGCGPNGSSVQ